MPAFRIVLATVALSAPFWPGPVEAHQIWIEQDAKAAKMFFGEFGDNLREVSPGFLDKFGKLTAAKVGPAGEQPLTVSKAGNAVTLAGKAGKGESIVIHDALYPLMERKEGDKPIHTLWVPAARFVTDPSAQKPTLPLDIVPTGSEGEFQVTFKGQPLPKAEVAVTTPFGWQKEGMTDNQGKVKFPLPWKGGYLIGTRHVIKTPGERTGPTGPEKYDGASYSTTLTLVNPKGIAAPPPSPPAKPNKYP